MSSKTGKISRMGDWSSNHHVSGPGRSGPEEYVILKNGIVLVVTKTASRG